MQPADPAATTQPAAADRGGEQVRAVGDPGPLVPPPRSAPGSEGVAVPQPRTASEALTDDGPESEHEPVVDPPASGAGLTARERDILAFEQQWWKHAGAKEQAIRDTFGLSATRYYQLLNALLDHPAALAAEPLLIGRLRRLRSSRARNRRR
ncbi:Protein of unknown function [Micromonospora rhizosphaerae]|uniref:DUF3263 domain-containing protein n=1 Tax=Micromonospora rhizosphaerae TaxID=568872 RepID=A0A1C6RB37_9ACTN|nr:DUF3263 domain-containing protein [Micromonospora rhizosphaerae]SCL14351.1 Protein of unknown function [Micromonospora rhizosphaerae]